MKQFECDIAIIGSGIGGLATAALLSKAGYRTIVVEKLPFRGGRCATLDFHGYKVDTGVSLVVDEAHGQLCREVGVDFEFRAVDPLLVCRHNGKDYPIGSPESMARLITDASRDEAEAGRVLKALMRGVLWAEPSFSMSFHDWLAQYADTPSVMAIFRCLVTSLSGLQLSEIPAGAYFRMIAEAERALLKTSGFPLHGGGSISEALVRAIRNLGGEVWTRCPALQINVDDGRTTGALIRKRGKECEIHAQAVISNAGPRRTVGLVGKDHFSSGYMQDVERLKSVPIIRILATSDRPLMEGLSVRLLSKARRLLLVWTPSNGCPDVAPEGKHLLAGFAFPPSALPPYNFKEDIALCLQDLSEHIPDFDAYGQILRIDTFHRDWPEYGTHSGYSLGIKTPVEGLYLVGDTSAPLGWFGSPAAIKSARLATEDVMRRYKPMPAPGTNP